ncbi:hypothetical protein BT96DRAFT_1014004 [Gymnopus androsaceus JB14]|uniref:DUF6534 domain-containing protein n=1 Tax=Gymnopus androsaceus JB14 TaxID=1447944 RepID=A0A6A4ICQ6_9AGAR|nr:hypothetical protein BT96DRAFT_1014004 [Gymnopus androsaceus JB14]
MSGLSAEEQAQINLALGGVVVSNYLSYLTMGIVLSATWTYFSEFPDDKWWFKTLVVLCVSICIVDTVGTGIWTYDWAVTNYGNPAALAFMHWAIPAEGFFLSTCAFIVQLFYAWRLWIVSMKNNWILPLVVGCLSTLGWCIGCWQLHILTTHDRISDFTLLQPVIYIWLGGSVGADVLITSSMIYYLDLRFRISPEFPSGVSANRFLHRRLRKLIVRTVECNLLSLFAQVIAVGLFNRSSVGFYFCITNMTIAKVYTFSLLVSLNSRRLDNSHGTSKGRVELPVLHTSSFPSIEVSAHIQQETTSDW